MNKEELQKQRETLTKPLLRLAKKYLEMSKNGEIEEGLTLTDTFDTYAALTTSIALINKDIDDFIESHEL